MNQAASFSLHFMPNCARASHNGCGTRWTPGGHFLGAQPQDYRHWEFDAKSEGEHLVYLT
jgi:hypothetical protein